MFRSLPFVMVFVAFAAHSVPAGTTTIDTTKTYQTIEGLGGAITFYDGWVMAHPYKLEIYTNAFAGLNLSMLRLADWYRYDTNFNSTGEGAVASDIVSNADRVLGHPVQVYMSSWAPPAFLKSNGQTGNGGTLIYTNGGFDYAGFAQYWYDSLQVYKSNGVSPTWISIQNEPDWMAGYDSCRLDPTEDTVGGTNYASYSKALDATYQKLTNMPSPPKILAPEVIHIHYNDLQNYAATMNSNSFYGVNYHLYGGSTDGSPDGYAGDFQTSTNIFPGKPHFMTEYGYPDMIQTACLIHDCLTMGNDSGINYWSLVWPYSGDALVAIENPYASHSTWTNAPPGVTTDSHGWWLTPAYWAMKHFSYFIQPGFRRVSASDNDSNVRSSAFLSPDDLRLVVVLINTNATVSSTMTFNFGIFNVSQSSVYQTTGTNTYAGTNTFLPLGPLTNSLLLPPLSITTVVLDQSSGPVGPATNPSPADGTSGVALNSPLSWTPGSNAVAHAVYLGTDSNAVAQATTSSPQFQGTSTTNIFYPPLAGGTTYFWRVDEFKGITTNIGSVWSFSTVPVPPLLHEYSFSESGGATTADSVGGPAWNGALPNGGTLAGGQLTLSSGSQQYVRLPAGIVSTLSNFTVMAWVDLGSTSNWARLFDFGNNTTVSMYLTPQNGNTGTLRFAITTNSSGAEQQINCNSSLTTDVWHQVAVTLNANTGILYLDGVPVGTNSTMTLNPLILGSTANNYLGKSQWPDPYLNGQIDEFRIYGVRLSPAEIAGTYALGPNQLLSTNTPTAFASMSGTDLIMSWPVASAGFTLQSSTNLASGNWVTSTSAVPQIFGTNWQIILPTTNAVQFFRLSK